MTKFTDESGAEYESFDILANQPGFVIRPIKLEPKYEILLMGNVIQVVFNPKPPEDQAQLIKECCEELMRVITEAKGNLIEYPPHQLLNLLNLARTAMSENN